MAPNGIRFTYTEDGEEVEHTLPSKFEVCSRCEGRGTHVNPSIDGHGITESEWNGPDWSEEEKETYLSGGYDVTCCECNGLRVVEVPDVERCNPDLLAEYDRQQANAEREEASDRHTRWMENGGRD